jgi:hypothetical protein
MTGKIILSLTPNHPKGWRAGEAERVRCGPKEKP